MTKAIVTRCFLVSLVVSILATFVTTSTAYVPDEGEVMIDLGAIDESFLNSNLFIEGTDAEINEYWESLPTREISGLERFTHAFDHPQVWYFFYRGFLYWFVAIFMSTLFVSYLNARDT